MSHEGIKYQSMCNAGTCCNMCSKITSDNCKNVNETILDIEMALCSHVHMWNINLFLNLLVQYTQP